MFGEHPCCCCARVGTHVGSLASVGMPEAERFRLVPDLLSTVQLEEEGSCSINHASLAFLGGNGHKPIRGVKTCAIYRK